MAHANLLRVNDYLKIFRDFPEATQANCVILTQMGKDLFLSVLLQLSISTLFYCIQGGPGGNFNILCAEYQSL
jgi:hypothetical protein